jgi:hypothetical protein
MKHCEATVTVTVPVEVVVRLRGRDGADLTPDAWEVCDIVQLSSPDPDLVDRAMHETYRELVSAQVRTYLAKGAKAGARKRR